MNTEINEELSVANEELLETQNKYINASNQSEKDRSDLLFTIDAAGLATFDIDVVANRFVFNPLLAAWPGFEPAEDIKLQQDIDTIAGYNRERVVKALNKAMQPEPGGNFDVEYTIINPKNPAPRMVRARGKILFNNPW